MVVLLGFFFSVVCLAGTFPRERNEKLQLLTAACWERGTCFPGLLETWNQKVSYHQGEVGIQAPGTKQALLLPLKHLL